MPEDHDFELDGFLARPLIAHLASDAPDGPRDSPLWFQWEDRALWFIGSARDSFPVRLRDEPRCAVGIVDFDLAAGRLHHVGMRGRAEIVPFDPNRMRRLLVRYLGEEGRWSPRFRETIIDRLDRMVRFDPATIVARDQSYFREPPA